MRKFGGGFVTALGEAGLLADEVNKARLSKAFPDYIITYTAIAAMQKNVDALKERQNQSLEAGQ